MPKSRSRGKRHNGIRRAQRFFDNTIVWTWEGVRDANGDQVRPKAMTKTFRGYELLRPDVINALMTQPNKWIVCVRAICMAETGDPWIDTHYVEWHGRLADVGERYLKWRAVTRAMIRNGWMSGQPNSWARSLKNGNRFGNESTRRLKVKRKAPTAAQKRFHDMVCSGGCIIPGCGAPARLHHCVGASAKHNKIEIGQWWVLPLCDEHHQHGPAACHVSPVKFAELVNLDSRKRAEKYLFSALLARLAVDGRDGCVPINAMEAIEGYTR